MGVAVGAVRVRTVVAVEQVDPGPAPQDIAARAADQPVGPVLAEEEVVAGPSADDRAHGLSAAGPVAPVGASDAAPRAARGSFGHGAGGQGDGNGHGVMDAELRQAVRRTSAKRVTPGRDFTGR